MKVELLQEVLGKINSVKISVIGDFCLDAYWFVDESKSEISIETGHLTRPVIRQKYSLGGAGNVTNNLSAMGVKDIRAFGVVGQDPFGPKMISLMKEAGINTDNILVQEEAWATHVYIKPYIEEDEQNRIDFGNYNILSEETADELLTRLQSEVSQVDLVIINQQVLSGINTEYFRKKLVEIIRSFPEKIFITDSRNFTDSYSGSYRKMNDIEAVHLCGMERKPGEPVPYCDVVYAAKTLMHRYQKPLFITRGSNGSLAVDESGIFETPGLMIISRVDTVGAGDSYLAGAAATLAGGFPIDMASEIGSYVAGVTVQKLFITGTASPSEILQIGQDPDYIYLPELAADIRQARYLEGTEIEIIRDWPKDSSVNYVIFDHDGTISTLREGWEQIMAPMMIKSILGDKFHVADEILYHKAESRVAELIDKTTGIQTLMQMKILLDLIMEFGFVPHNQMLDEFGYKEVYNNDLMLMVNERRKKLERGELIVEDLVIKNALPVLTKLYDSGVKLYLASGTDEEDVKNEAAILGYAHLFKGGIFGAVGDVNKEAKKIVLERIMETIGDSESARIVTFGDGPVEIRETHKRGGITVGVASNELRRFGLNRTKRTRLIKAGADIVIPDFSQASELFRLLNIN
jgi:rfaE bifunctional protein kinase chain/domain